nr:hypothetical protein [uncultured Cellulosilyticum sp.]
MSEEIKGFETIEELAAAKTREEIIEWAAEFGKCPWDYQLPSIAESECLQGQGEDGAKQCDNCWAVALKDIKCKGDEETQPSGRRTRTRGTSATKQEVHQETTQKEPDVEGLRSLCAGMTKTEFNNSIGEKQLCCKDSGFPNSFGTNCLHGKVKKQCQSCWAKVIEDNGITFKQGRTRTQKAEETPKIEPTKPLYDTFDKVDFTVNDSCYTGIIQSSEWITDENTNMYSIMVDDVTEPFYVYEVNIAGIHVETEEQQDEVVEQSNNDDQQEDNKTQEDIQSESVPVDNVSDLVKPLMMIAQSLKEISDNSFEIRKALSQIVDNQNRFVQKK